MGTLTVIAIITAGALFFNDQYAVTAAPGSINTAIYNASGTTTYFQDWSNQTATLVQNSQAVPFLGNGLVLIAGVFQVITLIMNIPNTVVIPLMATILGPSVLAVPGWFVTFCMVGLVIIVVIALVNAMKGSKPV